MAFGYILQKGGEILRKRKKLLLVVAILMLVLLVAMGLGYTYAKYTNSREVSGSSATATWSFDGAISNTSNETTKSISLAQTVSKDSVTTGKIAPGTNGTFKIIINAAGSEVDIDYDVLLKGSENNKPSNLYFTCEDLVDARETDGSLKKYYSLAEMLAVDSQTNRSNMSGTIDKDTNNTAKEITVNWVWPYESNRDGYELDQLDLQDTNDSGITDYSFTLNILGKQSN